MRAAHHSPIRRKRRALSIREAEDRLIAAAAIIGASRMATTVGQASGGGNAGDRAVQGEEHCRLAPGLQRLRRCAGVARRHHRAVAPRPGSAPRDRTFVPLPVTLSVRVGHGSRLTVLSANGAWLLVTLPSTGTASPGRLWARGSSNGIASSGWSCCTKARGLPAPSERLPARGQGTTAPIRSFAKVASDAWRCQRALA